MRKATTPMELLAAANLTRIFNARKYGPERLTQSKLAEQMGFAQQTSVSNYLTGKSTLGIEAIARFANALGVGPEEIRPDFYELLHLKQPPRTPEIIPVHETLTGESPPVQTLRTTVAMQLEDDSITYYAVLVDSDQYRSARIRAMSHLVVAEGLTPLDDDDVYIVTKSGEKHIAAFLAQSEEHLLATSLATGEPLSFTLDDVLTCDVIVAVENPQRPQP